MAEPEPKLFDDAKRELDQLKADLQEMARLRGQLALIEFQAAAGQVKRLAIVLTALAIAGLTSLPVLVVYVAEALDGFWLPRTAWLLTLGLTLLFAAVLGSWLAVKRFRRRFVGMEQTLEELREDLVWLEEWTGKR